MTGKICANLSKELRKTLKKRSLAIRKDDTVKITRGKLKGKEAKIIRVDRESQRAYLENITRKKADGTETNQPINVSNLQIIEIESKDEKRIKGRKITKKETEKVKVEEKKEVKKVN